MGEPLSAPLSVQGHVHGTFLFPFPGFEYPCPILLCAGEMGALSGAWRRFSARPAWTAQIKDIIATCQPLALNESSAARLKLPRDGIESCYGGMSWGPGGLCVSFLGCKVVQLGGSEARWVLGGAGGSPVSLREGHPGDMPAGHAWPR